MMNHPLLVAMDATFEAMLPSEHAKRYHETARRIDKEREALSEELRRHASEVLSGLASRPRA